MRDRSRTESVGLEPHSEFSFDAWLERVLPGEPRLHAVDDSSTASGVCIALLRLAPDSVLRNLDRGHAESTIIGQYLVCACDPDPRSAAEKTIALMFAALESKELVVEADALSAHDWLALRVAARPAFVVRAPLRRERAAGAARPVLFPVEVEATPVAPLVGRVVGERGVAIAGARVELPSLRLRTRADADGSFAFARVPANLERLELIVHARGREHEYTAQHAVGSREPLVIQLTAKE